MNIGQAIKAIKEGKRAHRLGWNGRDMWIAYSPGHDRLSAGNFWSVANKREAERLGGGLPVLPCITMKTATGEILMGWLASQTDLLSDDWEILD